VATFVAKNLINTEGKVRTADVAAYRAERFFFAQSWRADPIAATESPFLQKVSTQHAVAAKADIACTR
jgi:hypothetical protein